MVCSDATCGGMTAGSDRTHGWGGSAIAPNAVGRLLAGGPHIQLFFEHDLRARHSRGVPARLEATRATTGPHRVETLLFDRWLEGSPCGGCDEAAGDGCGPGTAQGEGRGHRPLDPLLSI